MSIKLLQEKIGTIADGAFGPNTLRAAMAYYKMTPYRAAHFFGQTAHETNTYRAFSENLNYSAGGLKKIFRKYFPGDLEEEYARKPEKIASRVYGNRMGNGDEESGDGWKYRGRGALQLTGKNNYTAKKTRGSITIFPAFLSHRVTPITNGTRHSLITWMLGDCFV